MNQPQLLQQKIASHLTACDPCLMFLAWTIICHASRSCLLMTSLTCPNSVNGFQLPAMHYCCCVVQLCMPLCYLAGVCTRQLAPVPASQLFDINFNGMAQSNSAFSATCTVELHSEPAQLCNPARPAFCPCCPPPVPAVT